MGKILLEFISHSIHDYLNNFLFILWLLKVYCTVDEIS